MIFHEDKLIYFHSGKTAGSSIEQMLAPGHGLDPYKANRQLMFGWDDELGIFLQHANCQTTRQLVDEEIFLTYFKFCVVRNPFSRLVSAYYYLYEQHQKGFGSFRNYILNLPRQLDKPEAKRGIHVSPQYDYTHIDGNQCVDAIVKFEELPRLETILSARLGRELKLPKVNVIKNPIRPEADDAALYDDEMIDIMMKVYQLDFETFDYEKKNLPAIQRSIAAMNPQITPRIFVQIPSYRDSQTQWTVKDLFAKAKFPERVFVGICWQFDCEKDTDCFVEPYPHPENVRVIEFGHTESQGLGWARQQAQTLAKDEEYTLQIDAHMRFEQDWDQLLIDMLNECPGDKNILSHYPPSFILPDRYVSDSVPYMYSAQINKSGISIEKSFSIGNHIAPSRPTLNYFIAGGMIFAPSDLFREVPPDPHIYFWGEQVGTAVRAWTRGWNIYSPNKNTIYHIYHPESGRPLNWDDNPDWVANTNKTAARMQYLLGINDAIADEYSQDLELLKLGTERELVEFEQLAGLRFRDRQIFRHTIDYCIERLRRAGATINDQNEDWYHSLYIIDVILYDEDDEKVLKLLQDFLTLSKFKRHRFTTQLHYAQRCLDKHRIPEAEEYAYNAMRTDASKPNGYAMVGKIHLRQGKYDEALPLLTTACQVCGADNFAVVVPKEPHPFTLLALTHCKRLMPAEAAKYAAKAIKVDSHNRSTNQAILEAADNPVGKEHLLFPDKKSIFDGYQAKNEITQDWKDWAKHNIANGADRNIIRLKIEDVGFKATLVKQLLDNLYSDAQQT